MPDLLSSFIYTTDFLLRKRSGFATGARQCKPRTAASDFEPLCSFARWMAAALRNLLKNFCEEGLREKVVGSISLGTSSIEASLLSPVTRLNTFYYVGVNGINSCRL